LEDFEGIIYLETLKYSKIIKEYGIMGKKKAEDGKQEIYLSGQKIEG